MQKMKKKEVTKMKKEKIYVIYDYFYKTKDTAIDSLAFKDKEKASNKDEEKASNEDKLASDWKADLDNEIFPAFPDKFKKSEQKIETPIIKTDEKIEPPVENEQPVFNGIPFIVHNPKYLKEYICRKNLLPYRCAICGLSEWQNEPLALELDSFNGVYTSSNLNNLRFLCPNCYS